ncbi:hypothetical protein ACRRTK_013292 [Alexandromys fortis]
MSERSSYPFFKASFTFFKNITFFIREGGADNHFFLFWFWFVLEAVLSLVLMIYAALSSPHGASDPVVGKGFGLKTS